MEEPDYYPLSEVKRHDCLGLLRDAMAEVGAASQTLAAMRRLARKTDSCTFASADTIAEIACRPLRTCERDLAKLSESGWVRPLGRQKRRTVTYEVHEAVLNEDGSASFATLPRWAAAFLPSWTQRAVFAAIVSRNSLNDFIAEEHKIDDCCRLQYPAKLLAKDTGLSVRAVGLAKEELQRAGLIVIERIDACRDELGQLRPTGDSLFLNAQFAVPGALFNRGAKVAEDRGAKLAE